MSGTNPHGADRAGLSVIVVTHDSAAAVADSIPAIAAELGDGDELIVVDNASADGTPDRIRELAPGATVIESDQNAGFGAACNRGAEAARGELLLFLNPDAVVQPGFRAAIALPLRADYPGAGWDAWQALVTAGGGGTVNSWGGVVHFTGIAWAGGAGRPVSEAPSEPREVSFASGACLAIRRQAWLELGGFDPDYFLYHEDTDLGLRLWRAGRRVGIEPRARVEHDYEFAKGPHKWLYLERNRWATILRTYPRRLLAVVLPALLATELALYFVAAAGGWLPQKLSADAAALRWTPRLLAQRRAIGRASRGAPVAEFATRLSAELDSAYLGRAADSRLLAALLRGYWRVATALLGRAGRQPGGEPGAGV